tara:strand:- start:150 stop:368 length:219 start_codon:yes stop_codon:yes gene_type:complete
MSKVKDWAWHNAEAFMDELVYLLEDGQIDYDEALDRVANSNEALQTVGINSIYDAEEYLSHMVDVRRVGEYA